jgi:response regulator RpfG family c-di-GMP phosphodiesterase
MKAKTILLADNLRVFMDVRRKFLEQEGYKVITADNPSDAEKFLKQRRLDLAILDIRLVNDDDPEDKSGIMLALKYGPTLPIILMTGFPTWEDVKTALGRDMTGLSRAVDFISKEEGPAVMLDAVKLTLSNPHLKQNMMQEFKAESSQALLETLNSTNPAETSDKFQASLDRTQGDLLKHREKIIKEAKKHQRIAIWAGILVLLLIFLGVLLGYLDIIPFAALSGAAGIITEVFSVLSISRAVEASKRVDENYQKLQEFYEARHLLTICDTIAGQNKRDDAKRLIIEKLLGTWFKS